MFDMIDKLPLDFVAQAFAIAEARGYPKLQSITFNTKNQTNTFILSKPHSKETQRVSSSVTCSNEQCSDAIHGSEETFTYANHGGSTGVGQSREDSVAIGRGFPVVHKGFAVILC